jgi:DNA-binding LacI/PurR family transcriptional regulator
VAAKRVGAVTIRDVARLSGVSIATVTRTFQGSPRVRPETQERVRAAAERLGYRPDSVARALVTGSSQTIGLLVPAIMQAYWGEIADAVELRAGELGYSVLLASTRGEPERERAMLELLMGKRLDGIILGGVAAEPGKEAWGPPLVLLEWDATPQPELLEDLSSGPLTRSLTRIAEQRAPGEWFGHVAYDDIAGSRLVVEHLLALGHEKVSFIAGPSVRTCLLRLLGMRMAMGEAGKELHSIHAAADSLESGHAVAAELLASPDRPTAVACYSDNIAIGVIKAAHELGLRVPEDVSITGYDDIQVASYIDPALTTLRNPKRQLAELALDLVVEGRESDEDHIEKRLTGTLVARASTAPPPA